MHSKFIYKRFKKCTLMYMIEHFFTIFLFYFKKYYFVFVVE
nr:MAG TPA: hypothetical protein [Caudoviricetes sp.]